MTNDSHLFKNNPASGRLPLFEGKMIWHFEHKLAEPRFWVSEKEGRKASIDGARFPKTAARLCLMWHRLQQEGFTSYWL